MKISKELKNNLSECYFSHAVLLVVQIYLILNIILILRFGS
jgi:hypothetical protein